MNVIRSYKETDTEEIQDLLLGRKVVKVERDTDIRESQLTLDDGTVITVVPNWGCGGCVSGKYYLTVLERVDNIITRVDFEASSVGLYDGHQGVAYKIFVLAGDERINLLSVEGDDGNGYYGTGYELLVQVN